MKSVSIIGICIALMLSLTAGYAQIKNAKTETVTIYGNCVICKTTIEKAGYLKKVASVDWNKDTKRATLIYDATKTSQAEILKRIALAGYDNDSFLAPFDVYAKLPECCHYERNPIASKVGMKMDEAPHSTTAIAGPDVNQMSTVFETYFDLKDALVQTDAMEASEKSNALLKAIKAVKMDQLSVDVHLGWMKVLKSLEENALVISISKDVARQRNYFTSLSLNMYELIKVSKYAKPVYYQHCPMFNDGNGANWLSKENEIQNPYYGLQMLTCGKTVETIK